MLRKGIFSSLTEILAWVIFAIIAGFGLFYLLKRVGIV